MNHTYKYKNYKEIANMYLSINRSITINTDTVMGIATNSTAYINKSETLVQGRVRYESYI